VGGFLPGKGAVDSFTSRVFVTLEDSNGFLDVIDAKSVKIIAAIPVPPYPLGVAVDSGAHRSYVADFLCGCGQISVVDNKTNKVVNTIHLQGASLVVGVALDQRDNFVYATDENSGFYVIDRTSGKVLGHISDHSYPNEVTAIPGTTLAVEPDTGSDRAVFVDALSFAVKKRVRVGKSPTGVGKCGDEASIRRQQTEQRGLRYSVARPLVRSATDGIDLISSVQARTVV